MKIPTEEEIIDEVQKLKKDMKSHDFQIGIGGTHERRIFNRINKILRMLNQPVRRIELDFSKIKSFNDSLQSNLKEQAKQKVVNDRN